MKIQGNGLPATYMSEFVARCCCWTISSQLLVRLIQLHWKHTPQQLYLVGAVLSLLFLCAIFGGVIRDWLFGEKSVMMLGIIVVFFGNIAFYLFPSAIYLGLALIFLGAGMVTSSTPLVVTDLAKPEKKGRAFTVLYGFTNAGVILGSVVGGLLFKYASWDTLVGFNVVLTAITLVIYFYTGFIANLTSLNTSSVIKFLGVMLLAVVLAYLYLKVQILAEAFLIIAGIGYAIFLGLVIYKRREIRKQLLIALLFIFLAIIFFSGEFQVASTLVDFSKNFVNLEVFNFAVPAGSLVALESIFVILGAYLISKSSYLSDKIGANKKVLIGLIFGVVAFTGLYFLSIEARTNNINFTYIVVIFCLFGLGDVILTPPIMSYVATISPKDIKGRLMAGTYFSFSVAGYLSGFIGEKLSENFATPSINLSFYSTTFVTMIIVVGIAGLIGIMAIFLNWQMRLNN